MKKNILIIISLFIILWWVNFAANSVNIPNAIGQIKTAWNTGQLWSLISTIFNLNGKIKKEYLNIDNPPNCNTAGSWLQYKNNAWECFDIYTYSWDVWSWWSCSSTCGGWTQSRPVNCRRNDGQNVDDSFCTTTKPAVNQACNTNSCPTYGSWSVGSWGSCSQTCSSSRTRSVWCNYDGCYGSAPSNSDSCDTTGSFVAGNGRTTLWSCFCWVPSWWGWVSQGGGCYHKYAN